jgi:hypothetical protein
MDAGALVKAIPRVLGVPGSNIFFAGINPQEMHSVLRSRPVFTSPVDLDAKPAIR